MYANVLIILLTQQYCNTFLHLQSKNSSRTLLIRDLRNREKRFQFFVNALHGQSHHVKVAPTDGDDADVACERA